jgi:hypothetical protein
MKGLRKNIINKKKEQYEEELYVDIVGKIGIIDIAARILLEDNLKSMVF